MIEKKEKIETPKEKEKPKGKTYSGTRDGFKTAVSDFHKGFVERLMALGLDDFVLCPEEPNARIQLLLEKFSQRPDISARLCGIASRGRKTEVAAQIGIQEAVRLIGNFNTRLFFCAELFSEAFENPLFARSADKGTLNKSVREILKHTKQMVDVVGEESRYRETAFASGLIYDALYYTIQENPDPEIRSRLNIFLEQQFKGCLEAIKQSLVLGKSLEKLVIGNRVPCLLALVTAGQVAMFCYYPDMVAIYRKLNEKAAFESVYRYAQISLCGGYSAQFSRQISLLFGLFSNIPLAIEYFSDPFNIKGKKSAHVDDQMTLAELCHFSWVITKYAADIERRRGSYPAKEVCPELENSSLIYEFGGT